MSPTVASVSTQRKCRSCWNRSRSLTARVAIGVNGLSAVLRSTRNAPRSVMRVPSTYLPGRRHSRRTPSAALVATKLSMRSGAASSGGFTGVFRPQAGSNASKATAATTHRPSCPKAGASSPTPKVLHTECLEPSFDVGGRGAADGAAALHGCLVREPALHVATELGRETPQLGQAEVLEQAPARDGLLDDCADDRMGGAKRDTLGGQVVGQLRCQDIAGGGSGAHAVGAHAQARHQGGEDLQRRAHRVDAVEDRLLVLLQVAVVGE